MSKQMLQPYSRDLPFSGRVEHEDGIFSPHRGVVFGTGTLLEEHGDAFGRHIMNKGIVRFGLTDFNISSSAFDMIVTKMVDRRRLYPATPIVALEIDSCRIFDDEKVPEYNQLEVEQYVDPEIDDPPVHLLNDIGMRISLMHDKGVLTMTHLSLYNCRIGSAAARFLANALSRNTTITDLVISRCLGEDSAAHLTRIFAENKHMTSVSLSHNYFANKQAFGTMCTALARNQTVHTLCLQGCSIDDDTAVHIADVIRQNKKIAHLDISGNKIDDTGIEKITEAAATNTTLRNLDVQNNFFTVIDIASLGPLFTINRV